MLTFPVVVTVSCDLCATRHTGTYDVPEHVDYGVHVHAAAQARERLAADGWRLRRREAAAGLATSAVCPGH